ncbi:hypothetical protein CN543_04715 [Bacillus toyonensis]|uniref:hypothetical protein n=1 Tax=Bacillus TaxID=1386 RepID=UPI000BF13DF3|nr:MULTISPECIES: hypothetical protein [Bacillus]MBF7150677.1 hypothetical protein [Bacillus toyonensis]MBY7104973.1 hypothetical protein [Bacillus sp. 6YEL31]MBY7131320.1 hypothetical protein [Bacillus sp. 8YEL33]MEC2348187.1 hypothetical protein [Bacillus toyonensis]MED3188638.1 hypothetical protein [Bacillus toyonensis]
MQKFFEAISAIGIVGYFLGKFTSIPLIDKYTLYFGVMLMIGVIGRFIIKVINSEEEETHNSNK